MTGAYVLARELNVFGRDYEAAFSRYDDWVRPLVARKQQPGKRLASAFARASGSVFPSGSHFQVAVHSGSRAYTGFRTKMSLAAADAGHGRDPKKYLGSQSISPPSSWREAFFPSQFEIRRCAVRCR